MIIRQVELSDLDAVSKLECVCFPNKEAATRESLKYRIVTFPESFFLALEGDKIVGFVNGCVTDNLVISDELFELGGGHNPNGKNQTIFGLLVDLEYQKKGIATKLMNHIKDVAKNAGREKMILTCKEHLIKYYEGFGYVNQGVSKSTHGDAVWYDMVADL